MLKMKWQAIDELVAEGFIKTQKHPQLDLWIYNYTQKCQFSRNWTPETVNCRGLIVNSEKTIVARPFEKFFNLGELEGLGLQLPNKPFSVYEKFDGSLGIVFYYAGDWHVATRGSFTSDQAIKGKQILDLRLPDKSTLNKDCTYLFEIIYPENRIVVDYGSVEDLILLAIRDTKTGAYISLDTVNNIPKTKRVEADDIQALQSLAKPNSEGFVIVYDGGFRVKVKFDEYVRLHRIVTGINARRVWEVLKNGDSLDEFLENVPEEFEAWIIKMRAELWNNYLSISTKASYAHGALIAYQKFEKWDRKQSAQWIMHNHKEYSSIIFKMMDGQPYSHIIWKMIKPEATEPFKVEI